MLPIIKVKSIISDHGSQFGKKWSETLQTWGIKPIKSTIRHPQSNNVERYMSVLGRCFRTYASEKHTTWTKYLARIENCLNNVPNISTSFTPHHLLYGKASRYALQAEIERYVHQHAHTDVNTVREIARKNMKKHADIRVKRQDKRAIWTFSVGDKVLLHVNRPSDSALGKTKKFNMLYEGPYRVTNIPYANVYELSPLSGNIKIGRYNTRNLIPYME